MTWKAGASRQEVTCWEEGIYLFGWGMEFNKALSAATPMYARALVLDDGTTPLALVLVDIGIITYTIRRFALRALRERFPDCTIADEHILISATHTHSGPSGYSEYLFYGFSGPGLSRKIVDTYAHGIATAIGTAWRERDDARVRYGKETMPLTAAVAFNRSLVPYHANEELSDTHNLQADEATHRHMTVLRVDRAVNHTPLAVFSWFATHSTSVHADHTEIHADNRGLAAVAYEQQLSEQFGDEVVTAFAQEAAGDVSPNFRWNTKRGFTVGVSDDDNQSAQYVADKMRHLAHHIFSRESALIDLQPSAAGDLVYIRVPGFQYHSTHYHQDITIGDAVVGMGFMEGTKEGPGPLRRVRGALRAATGRLQRANGGRGKELREHHGNKIPFLDTGKGRHGAAFGLFPLMGSYLPTWLDGTVRTYGYYRATDALDDHPWTPTVLPFQVLRIGHLWLATLPGEPTTMVGQRLRKRLAQTIVQHAQPTPQPPEVVIAAYANDYTSYITTTEEYAQQWYEGSTTIFGPYSWDAMGHILNELTLSIATSIPFAIDQSKPPTFSPELFAKRDYRSAPASVRNHIFAEET